MCQWSILAKIQFFAWRSFRLQKGIKNLKKNLERKSMDQKLSNDVFGMFIRFLGQILWKF